MAEVVCKCGIKRKPGYLYFVNKQGNAACVPMARGKKKGKGKMTVVHNCKIKRAEGYLYFIDKKGNVARVKMARKKKRR